MECESCTSGEVASLIENECKKHWFAHGPVVGERDMLVGCVWKYVWSV